jgi:hypothetical protein
MWKNNIFTLSMDKKNGLSRMLSGECSQYTTATDKTGIGLQVVMLVSLMKNILAKKGRQILSPIGYFFGLFFKMNLQYKLVWDQYY